MIRHKKYAEFMQSYELRESLIREFVNMLNPKLEVSIARLVDPLGPAATDGTVTLLTDERQ
jgi:phosphopantetheine adenylyltransferase